MSRQAGVMIALAAILVLALLLHVGIGSYFWYRPWDSLSEIMRGPMASPTVQNSIIWDIRLPRALMAVGVGVTLGLVGSAFQAQLRNPLADPYIVGVSSGAALGGVAALLLGFGTAAGGLGMVACGFATGMGCLALVMALARRRGLVDVTTMLLAGVAVGALISAITSLGLLAAGQDTNRVLEWLLGSLANAQWPQVWTVLASALIGGAILVSRSRHLNAFAVGEDTAGRLGIDVPRLRSVVLATGTAMTAAAVGAVGIIGFLGLVAPHIARRILGVDWRWSLAGAGLIGGILLLFSDLLAQRMLSQFTMLTGFEVPVGIVTAILGAPSLLILLRRSHP
jgi:iron complex transport system permease protein